MAETCVWGRRPCLARAIPRRLELINVLAIPNTRPYGCMILSDALAMGRMSCPSYARHLKHMNISSAGMPGPSGGARDPQAYAIPEPYPTRKIYGRRSHI